VPPTQVPTTMRIAMSQIHMGVPAGMVRDHAAVSESE